MRHQNRVLTAGLICLGVVLRLLPHPQNITPIGGLALFAGARLSRRSACLMPLMIMLLTDLIVGFRSDFATFTLVTPFVYGSLQISVWIGSLLRQTERPWVFGTASITASLQFFAVSNFGMWVSGISFYPLTFDGLTACYLAGLPYLGRTIATDLLYCGFFLGLYSWLVRATSPKRPVPA